MEPLADRNAELLRSIEQQIVDASRENAEITDYDVRDALDALTRQYSAEVAGRTAAGIPMDRRAVAVYRGVKDVCDYQTGRVRVGSPLIASPVPKTEVVAALRAIGKSVKRESGRSGKRGYLDFVKSYLP